VIKKRISILHVDDDKVVLEFTKKTLKSDNIIIYTATNLMDAIELYETKRPDILILDINMPDMNGLEFAKDVKAANKDIKIIMLSGYDDKEKLLDAIDIQVDKYLIKPVKPSELSEIVEYYVTYLTKEFRPKNIVFLKYGFVWNMDTEILYKNNNEITLTRKETQLISLLVKNGQKPTTTADILKELWDEEYYKDYDTSKIRGLIGRLKKKLDQNIFSSIYGVGYKLKYDR